MTNLSILSKQIRLHDGLYSLNDLHKAAGSEGKHRPDRFLRLEQTQDLITEINSCPDMGNSFKTLRGIGSFGCKELVYAYAMWISPKFHLQVIRAFDAQQQLAITKAPSPLDYQRIMLTIENEQTTLTQSLKPEDMVTSWDKLPNMIAHSFTIRPYQLLEISKAVNEKLTKIIHKR